MPRGMREDALEEGQALTEQMIFKVSPRMKREVIVIGKFLNYNSYGEYFRSLHRANSLEVMGSTAFKVWLKMVERDKNHVIEEMRTKAKELGYEIRKIDQRQL